MLSKCYHLQQWNGRGFTESQLYNRIYANCLPDPENGVAHTLEELNAFRPFVLVGINAANPLSLKKDAVGGTLGDFAISGSLIVAIDQLVVGESESEIDDAFQTLIDNVICSGNPSQPGLIELMNTAGSLAITDIVVDGIFRMQPEEVISKGDAQRAYLRIEWSIK
jgi:hypothetical protein